MSFSLQCLQSHRRGFLLRKCLGPGAPVAVDVPSAQWVSVTSMNAYDSKCLKLSPMILSFVDVSLS